MVRCASLDICATGSLPSLAGPACAPDKRLVYSIGIYVAARASACPGREEARPFESAGKPFPV
jgi:hypothetical protein